MSDLDFYKTFNQQTISAYGDLSGDYPTAPVSDSQKASSHTTSQPASGGTDFAQPTQAPASRTPAPAVPETQSYSYMAPMGPAPAGYRASMSCHNCEYFCHFAPVPHCSKYDFPCHSTYVCDGYESLTDEDELEMYSGLGSDLKLEVVDLTSEEIEILAQGWTDSGNVESGTRKKKAVLSEGRFPIFDKKSAESAIKLRGKARTPKERKRILRVAANYAPEAAKRAMEEDKQSYSISHAFGQDRVPSNKALFALAYNSADVVEGDVESIHGVYTELYQNLFGTKEGLYVQPQTQNTETQIAEQKTGQGVENLSEFEAQVSVPSYSGVQQSLETDPLYQIAENRILLKARQEDRAVEANEILTEYSRLKSLRQSNN